MREILKHLKVFVRAYRVFKETFDTPLEGSLAIRWLYILTNGWFNDIFHFFYSLKHPMKPFHAPYPSLMPGYSEALVSRAVEGLRRDGFYVFEQKLPESLVDELYNYALVTPSLHQTAAGTNKELGSPFDPNNIVATNYRIPERLVVNNAALQRLLADPVIVRVAQEYLRSQIYFLNEQIWWTTPKDCDTPASHLAQLYHFDMDRIKFMKFFVYLTDVDPESGPHCYVKGSCARKPKVCLEDRRYTDEELHKQYPADRFVEITGPRATLLAVDTRGFHKAKMPTAGNRLIVQIEIANSLFGPNYGHHEMVVSSPELRKLIELQPEMFKNYLFVDKLSNQPTVQAAVPAAY